MARLAFKPDSSFFRKIALGAVGARAVQSDLKQHGHEVVELERGSTDTKLWKDVKRKRVRIPDLVCRRCGLRIESRAKTKPGLSMSHSPNEEARAWDFGMVDDDCVAFAVCTPIDETYWSTGRVVSANSYWHERNWVRWQSRKHINYFPVGAFRSTPHTRRSTKGVTEGSETSIAWDATFSTRTGRVDTVAHMKVTIRRDSDGHRYTWNVKPGQHIWVGAGDVVKENQVVASAAQPMSREVLRCCGVIPDKHIAQLLSSRERTQRFTGIKLARLRREREYEESIDRLTSDPEEDVYIRLEGACYLASVCGRSAKALFTPFYESLDQQTQLEAIIAIGEAATSDAVEMLCLLLDNEGQPYFLRSAAAWSLSRVGNEQALARLVRAFADIHQDIREEALEGLVSIGGPAVPVLLEGLRNDNTAVAAGCAESLRQQHLPEQSVAELTAQLRSENPSHWVVWLLGHLPQDHVAAAIADLQRSAPHLHYAVSVLWSFVESWISRRWELRPHADNKVGDGK